MGKKENFMNINLDFYSKEYKNLNKLGKYCKRPTDKREIKTFNMSTVQTKKLKKECMKKCNSLKDSCNVFKIQNDRGNKTCTTFETCIVDDTNNSFKGQFYAKKYTESFSMDTIFFIIIIIEMFVMILLGIFAYSKHLRLKLND